MFKERLKQVLQPLHLLVMAHLWHQGATSPAKLVDPTTGNLVDQVTIDGQGTYTINNETGVVTFVPLKTFTGTATPVTVSLTATLGQDKDGQPITATATATYTPTVTPVTPTATPAESTGIKALLKQER